MFSNSDLFLRGQIGQLLSDWKNINGVEVPLVILGDPAELVNEAISGIHENATKNR